MNSKNISELTQRLSKALDQNYDVINMDTVMSVISALEGTHITKEQLETTRLAKYINQLRRRTKCENLARRSKSLLKKWREMVGIQQPQLTQQLTNNKQHTNDDIIISSTSSTSLNSNLDSLQRTNFIQQPIDNIGKHERNKHGNDMHFDGVVPSVKQTQAATPFSTSSSLTSKSANKNMNKRLENNSSCTSEGFTVATLMSTSVPTDRKQPTSFANLLTTIHKNDNCFSSSKNLNKNVMVSETESEKFKLNQHLPQQQSEVFLIDNSSNSNSGACAPMKYKTPSPIVINIQDSNSSSELNVSYQNNSVNAGVSISKELGISSPASLNRAKKTKKEKKRIKNRDNEVRNSNSVPMIEKPTNAKVNFGKNKSFSQDHNHIEEDHKCQEVFVVSQISDTLSLSNSSMSSVFPSGGDVSNSRNKKQQQMSDGNRSNRAPTDLTFAGKFNKSKCSNELPNSNNSIDYDLKFNQSSNSQQQKQQSQEKLTSIGAALIDSLQDSNSSIRHAFERVHQYLPIGTSFHENIQGSLQAMQRNENAGHSDLLHDIKKSNEYPANEINKNIVITTLASNVHPIQAVKNEVTEQKIPKKRGRKKGSKGVDSVIAKETSLSSQILSQFGSGCKKVKTTKELYAEIQNRKLGICSASTSPTIMRQKTQDSKQAAIRIDSSCSDLSLQSPPTVDAGSTTNSSSVINRSTPDQKANIMSTVCLDSDSDTLTSCISRDENGQSNKTNQSKNKLNKNRIVSNIVKPTPVSKTFQQTVLDKQLEDILKRHSCAVPSLEEIEAESLADCVPCTCKLYTVDQMNQRTTENQSEKNDAAGNNTKFSNDLGSNQLLNYIKPDETIVTVNLKSKENQAIIKNEPGAALIMPVKSNESKTKSIFDIDFDDDDDPLDSFLANSRLSENVNGQSLIENNNSFNTETNAFQLNIKKEEVENDSEKKMEYDLMSENAVNQMPFENTQVSIYNIEEDTNCEAKQRLEIQTQEITKFHIHTLHNYFIPNVNGNWNDVPSSAIALDNAHKLFNDTASKDVFDGNVVPKYGIWMNERIQKDFSNFNFTKNFQRTEKSEKLNESVKRKFLGVAQGFFNSKYSNKINDTDKKRDLLCKMTETKDNVMNLKADAKLESKENLFAKLTVKVDGDVNADIDLENNQNLLTISTDFGMSNDKIPSLYSENKSISKQELNCDGDLMDAEREINAAICSRLSRRSSCCSNTSLKTTQQQINEKLKNLPKHNAVTDDEIMPISRKRKHNKKKSSSAEKSTRRVVKCLKIAINGSIATRREIAISRETSDDEDEIEQLKKGGDFDDADEDEEDRNENVLKEEDVDNDEDGAEDADGNRSNSDSYVEEINSDNCEDLDDNNYGIGDGSFHQVINSNTDNRGNHIVLTIKKTPSKNNSPSHFSTLTVSPKIQHQQQHECQEEKQQINRNIGKDNLPFMVNNNIKTVAATNKNESQKTNNKILPIKIEKQQLCHDVKEIEKSSENIFDTNYDEDKQYCDLFFPDELYIRDSRMGIVRDNVLNIGYCSSDWNHKLPKNNEDKTEFEPETATAIATETETGSTATAALLDISNGFEKYYSNNKILKIETKKTENDRLDQHSDNNHIADDDANISSNESEEILSNAQPFPSTKRSILLLSHDYEQLPLENNGLLVSFKNIYQNESIVNHKVEDVNQQYNKNWKNNSEQLFNPNRKCDVFEENFLNNNNNISSTNNNNIDITDKRNIHKLKSDEDDVHDNSNLVRSSNSSNISCSNNNRGAYKKDIYSNINVNTINNSDASIEKVNNYNRYNDADDDDNDDEKKLKNLKPHKEYHLGLRTVDVDVHDENGKNCARVQEFKEWYEVLQLHSYKNELLTVMPYVVLD